MKINIGPIYIINCGRSYVPPIGSKNGLKWNKIIITQALKAAIHILELENILTFSRQFSNLSYHRCRKLVAKMFPPKWKNCQNLPKSAKGISCCLYSHSNRRYSLFHSSLPGIPDDSTTFHLFWK